MFGKAFKSRKHYVFDYKPRYYDERKERIENLKLKYSDKGSEADTTRIHFTKKLDLHYGDYMFFEKRITKLDRSWFKKYTEGEKLPPEHLSYGWKGKNCKISFEAHTDAPEEMFESGDSCLRIDVLAGKETIQNNTIGGGTYYGDYEEGKKYRMEVWLKQKGLQGTVDYSETAGGREGQHWDRPPRRCHAQSPGGPPVGCGGPLRTV